MSFPQQYLIWPVRSLNSNERVGDMRRVTLDGYHAEHSVVQACFKLRPHHDGFRVRLALVGKNSLSALYSGQTVRTICNAQYVAIRKVD